MSFSSLAMAVMNGHKGVLSRVLELKATVRESSLADPNLDSVLKIMEDAATTGTEICMVKLTTLVKSLEYVVTGINVRDEKIKKLQADVEELQLEVSVQRFRSVFGDYTSNCVTLIIDQFESSCDKVWEVFYRQLMRERRLALQEFQLQHPSKASTDASFITMLYKKPKHAELLLSAQQLNWSDVECDLLFVFNEERNNASHSGLSKVSHAEKCVLVAQHKAILNMGVPAGMEDFEEVLKKAVDVFANTLK